MIKIIAEAGVNHNGQVDMALKLVDLAHDAGADVIKFQTWVTDLIVSKDSLCANYQQSNGQTSQYDLLKSLELSYDDFGAIKAYADSKGIEFLTTADDIPSLMHVNTLQNYFKIGSGEVTNYFYLKAMASIDKPIYMSTGLCDVHDIDAALSVLRSEGLHSTDVTLLQTTTAYPTPDHDANLRTISFLRDRFGLPVGFSDHTIGVEASIMAVALGATVIEKHVTLDNNLPGPDHKASINAEDFVSFVTSIRRAEAMLGSREKVLCHAESENVDVVRKVLVASTEIVAGSTFTFENLTAKRAGVGINPMHIMNVIGSRATRDYCVDDVIHI